MKIYLVSNMYPTEEHPSYGVFVKNTEDILIEAGWTVTKTVLTKKTLKIYKLLSYLLYYLEVLCKGLMGRYDILYVHYAAHNSLPLLILKKLKKRVVIYTNVHGSDVVPELKSQEKFQPNVKKLLQQSEVIISPSNYYKNVVSEKYNIQPDKIKIFPSGGVNKRLFKRVEHKQAVLDELNLDPLFQYIGFVGRIDVGKGWDIFLQAIAILKKEGHLKNRKIIFIGKGAQQEECDRLIEALDLKENLLYYPLLPQEMLGKIYNCLDVFCFPTTRKGESLGLVGLEAMACGVPVIGSRIGGLLDYIEDGYNGFLFDIGSHEELKDKLINFFNMSDEERQLMSNAAYYTAQDYVVETIKPHLIEIFSGNKGDKEHAKTN